MRQVHAQDMNTGAGMFSFLSLGIQKEQYFDVMSVIQSSYQVFLDAHKIYLVHNDFPSSTIKKFLDFLQSINLVKEEEEQSSQSIMSTAEVWQLFEGENDKQEMPRKIICRYEFVQKMLLISFQNFLKLGRNQSEFREYFQEHVIQELQSLVTKQGQAFSCFRTSILWAENVNRVLTSNKAALVAIFKRFQIKNAFTIESAKTMLKEANIELTRQKRISHDERVQRLFGMSK